MKTKIIATVGPSCFSKEKIHSLIESGVTCFRVNLSHGTKSQKSKCFDLIRSSRLKSGIRPTLLADLAGPKIRVRRLESHISIKKGEINIGIKAVIDRGIASVIQKKIIVISICKTILEFKSRSASKPKILGRKPSNIPIVKKLNFILFMSFNIH